MKSYTEKFPFFKRYFGWFEKPRDISHVAAATFFSYEDESSKGFIRTISLTTVINLTLSLELIWEKFRKKFICEQINRGMRRGIVVQQSDDFKSFNKFYKDFHKGKSIASVSLKLLEDQGILFLAWYEGAPIAGGVFIGDGIYMRAWVLASTRMTHQAGRMRDIIGEANRMIIWEAIRYAKKYAYQRFDLGGILPESENVGIRAVAEFKEAFGGERINSYYYSKTYVPVISRIISSSYFLKVRGILRKVKNIFD